MLTNKLLAVCLTMFSLFPWSNQAEARNCPYILDTTVLDIKGNKVNLCTYQGKVLLIVNTASKCGFTGQYSGLQKLYEKYKHAGFEILAFPSNDFAGQEPGSEQQIADFCQTKFQVSFPMFSKVHTKGKNQDELYKKLSSALGLPKWNFWKYLVNRQGQPVNKFPAWEKPLSDKLIRAIEAELKKKIN